MQKFNIAVKRVYSKNGEEKAFWPSVGTLTFFPASQEKEAGYRLELNMFPNTQFYVFKIEEQAKARPVKVEQSIETEEVTVDPDDIPF